MSRWVSRLALLILAPLVLATGIGMGAANGIAEAWRELRDSWRNVKRP